MSKTELKVVGEIPLPDYKDPVKMLRNIADNIEKGEYGEVQGVAVVTGNADGAIDVFGGGKYSDTHSTAFLLGSAHQAILDLPFGD